MVVRCNALFAKSSLVLRSRLKTVVALQSRTLRCAQLSRERKKNYLKKLEIQLKVHARASLLSVVVVS